MYLEKQADMPVRYNTYVTSRDHLCKNLAKNALTQALLRNKYVTGTPTAHNGVWLYTHAMCGQQ